uniref:Novel protein similar to Akap81 n=1 Tax=Xenopus tropicalis TaxID=8364 RepID=B4F6P4_XENTR|nr:Novel protein similar to Akap81 [Xenopus tropicalis]
MDDRGGAGYMGGYDSYRYDYGQDSGHSYSSKSWQTSYPMSSSDDPGDGTEAHHMTSRYSSYDMSDRMGFGSSEPGMAYGNRREMHQSYPPQRGWGGGHRRGMRGNLGASGAGRGPARPPPLLNPMPYSEMAGFQGLRAFTGNSYFGGGFKQKTKRLNRERARQKKAAEGEGPPPEKKGKSATSTEDAEEAESDGNGANVESAKATKNDGDDNEVDEKETAENEKSTEEKKAAARRQQETQSKHLRDRMVERIQFICSLCKFRTFYEEEMSNHLQSDFHKEHFRYIGGRLPKQQADFLEEYVRHKAKKTEERRVVVEDLSSTIQQIYRDQDLTQGLGLEHFIKKVEAAHCAACDIFIPMHFSALQRHLKSPLHNQNRRNTMEQSKKSALAVARSILNNKHIGQKLQRYIKGENPFTDDQEENLEGDNAPGHISTEASTMEEDAPSAECPPDEGDIQSSHEPAAAAAEQEPSTEDFSPQESWEAQEGADRI